MEFNHLLENIGGNVARAVQFGHEQVIPALNDAVDIAGEFTKKKIVPALGDAAEAVREFTTDTAVPALGNAARAVEDFRREQLGPFVEVTLTKAEDLGKNVVGPALEDLHKSTLGPALDQLGIRKEAEDLAEKTAKWLQEHPAQAAIIATSVVVPGVISGPILSILGYGNTGVRAGSIAAGIQSHFGNVGARSLFAFLESAQMGGYGTAVINGAVQAGGGFIGAAEIINGIKTSGQTGATHPQGDNDQGDDVKTAETTSEEIRSLEEEWAKLTERLAESGIGEESIAKWLEELSTNKNEL